MLERKYEGVEQRTALSGALLDLNLYTSSKKGLVVSNANIYI